MENGVGLNTSAVSWYVFYAALKVSSLTRNRLNLLNIP